MTNREFSFRERIISIYNGDCSDLIKTLSKESVDLIITSPPYCMGKVYERPKDDVGSFQLNHEKLLPECIRVLKKGGSLCWQIGYHVKDGVVVPLDILVYNLVFEINKSLNVEDKLILRNRIIWTFGHGLNSNKRFSGRHEVILWFTKGVDYQFNLDDVRIPQKYPGKTFYKGDKKGELSGNPLGKNPSDVWDIPNVKANHVEKTKHPCQFPIVVPQRLIKSLTYMDGVVLDPFLGSGTTAIASVLEKRNFIGAELNKEYFDIACQRVQAAIDGTIKYRDDKPIYEPNKNLKVAKKPDHFV